MAKEAHTLKWAWDRQWRSNILSTCGHHLDPDTGAALTQAWVAFFAGLPKAARVVDVGTGNGVIPLLALSASEQANKGFDIHGTDMAAIRPAQVVPEQASQLAKITFHPETPTEKLPFKAETVDALTSQHAIEYGNLDTSLSEVARVLKPGGQVRFLMHASDGMIVQANMAKIAQCLYVLEQAELFEKTRQTVEDSLKGRGDDGTALQALLATTKEKFQNDANTSDLMELLGLLWGAYEQRAHFPDIETFYTWLEENRQETCAQKLRIEAMRDAALSETEAKGLVKKMTALGFGSVNFSPVKSNGGNHLLGWLLEGKK